VVLKELGNHWYKTSAYFWAKQVSDLPIQLSTNLMYIGVMWLASGQPLVLWRFMVFYAVIIIVAEFCQTMGAFFGTLLSNDVVSATLVAVAFFLPSLLFSGILVRVSGMNWFFWYLSLVSILKWSNEIIILAIFGYERCKPSQETNLIEKLGGAKGQNEAAQIVMDFLEINRDDTAHFSRLLGTEASCFESVYNASSEYLGLDQGANDDYADFAVSNSSAFEDDFEALPYVESSYVLSFFELRESIVFTNTVILLGMLFAMKLGHYLLLVMKTRTSR